LILKHGSNEAARKEWIFVFQYTNQLFHRKTSDCDMRTATKILIPLLLVLLGWAAEAKAHDFSDQDYEKLKRYASPSNFYPDGNAGQLTLLSMCIDRGDVDVLEKLLNAAPKFANVVTWGSGSPAHWAAFKGNTNVLGVLLKHGAEINKKGTDFEMSPLFLARDFNTAEFLIRHGADLECKAARGQTPLMWAAKRGYTNVAKCLLEHGAKLDTREEGGRTALAFAEACKQTNIVVLLIAKGAVPPTDKEKKSALYEGGTAVSGGNEDHPFGELIMIYSSPEETKK
jgi:ankyrin repeat protein